MKQIQSKAYNVTEDIVGKITFNKHLLFQRSNYILVGEGITCAHKGFAATVTKVKKKQSELDLEQQTGSKLGIHQGCILLPCLFNLYAKYIM